jgi:hypothetical protein
MIQTQKEKITIRRKRYPNSKDSKENDKKESNKREGN